MSRRAAAPHRTILPDPKFGNDMLAKFINMVMERGKKSAAEKIVYGAIDKIGDKTEVTTELHVAVKLLGIVLFRQEAERTERWLGNRMIAFKGVTTTNGVDLEVRGEAQGNNFVITTPDGVFTAPANVHPSNPWSLKVFESDVMMSTKTGEFFPVSVNDSGQVDVTIDGADLKLHRYDIIGHKHDIVWMDDGGAPVAFEIEQGNSLIDFHLTRSLSQPEYVSADLSR